MWKIKTFKTEEAMQKWIARHKDCMQITEIFVNNGFGVEYHKLHKM